MNFDKTAIEEANKHLQALSHRVLELDAIVKQQAEKLESIEVENQAKIDAIVRQKNAEIEKRDLWLQSTQAEIRRLNIDVINKDVTILQLSAKAAILDKAFRYKGELEGLLGCFGEVEKLRAAASGASLAPSKPAIPQVIPITNTSLESKDTQESSESSLSEEDFSETDQNNIIWTPKAKMQPDDAGLRNLSLNGKKLYSPPVRVPGNAVKNAGDAAMDTEPEVTSKSDPSPSTNAGYEADEPLAVPLANFETQL